MMLTYCATRPRADIEIGAYQHPAFYRNIQTASYSMTLATTAVVLLWIGAAPEQSVLWSIGMPASCSRAGPEPTWCEAEQVGAVPLQPFSFAHTDSDHAGASPRVLWSDPEQQAEQCRLLWSAPGLIHSNTKRQSPGRKLRRGKGALSSVCSVWASHWPDQADRITLTRDSAIQSSAQARPRMVSLSSLCEAALFGHF